MPHLFQAYQAIPGQLAYLQNSTTPNWFEPIIQEIQALPLEAL